MLFWLSSFIPTSLFIFCDGGDGDGDGDGDDGGGGGWDERNPFSFFKRQSVIQFPTFFNLNSVCVKF